MSFLRAATRTACFNARPKCVVRRTAVAHRSAVKSFSMSVRRRSEHGEETYDEFTKRYEDEFNNVQDVFELQRNLNNAFAYDLVPSPSVLIAALRAARRVNDFPTAVRIFEGIGMKVENKGQYEEYLKELEPIREELGITLSETMFPEGLSTGRPYEYAAWQSI